MIMQMSIQLHISPKLYPVLRIVWKKTVIALSWLDKNKMVTNPKKFHIILLRKTQTNTSGEKANING